MASALLLFIIIIIICVSMHLFLVHRNPNFAFDLAMPSVSFEDIFSYCYVFEVEETC